MKLKDHLKICAPFVKFITTTDGKIVDNAEE